MAGLTHLSMLLTRLHMYGWSGPPFYAFNPFIMYAGSGPPLTHLYMYGWSDPPFCDFNPFTHVWLV